MATRTAFSSSSPPPPRTRTAGNSCWPKASRRSVRIGQETLWDNLKPVFDQAASEGLNRLVWHAFICSPAEMGLPGQEYFAGTHFNPNSTWWNKSPAFLAYLNRCQYLLQQGLFVADVCYLQPEGAPRQFVPPPATSVAPHVRGGYNFDGCTPEAVLTRMSVADGRIVLPDGMSYRALVIRAQR